MGFEVGKGRYVTFDKDELDELRPASTQAIEVSDFVALEEIDPDLLRAHVLARAPTVTRRRRRTSCCWRRWRSAERVAIGTVVMRNKQYLTAIRPLDGALAMSTMRFADEVVPRADIDGMPAGGPSRTRRR